VQEIKAGKRRGKIICADGYEIADIGLHRDLAEFQYDIRGNTVFFRKLDGWWPEALRNAEEFRLLGEKMANRSEFCRGKICSGGFFGLA